MSDVTPEHAAMLDALVAAGVLHEETDAESGCDWLCPEWSHYYGETCANGCRHFGGDHPGPHECVNGHTVERDPGDRPARTLRRYVTEWEVRP